MDQNDNRQNGFLYALLANPAAGASLYVNELQRLVDDYPQSGLLQALLAHASDDKNLKQASAYFNPRLLYKLINNPGGFRDIDPAGVFIEPRLKQNGSNSQTTAVFHLTTDDDKPVDEINSNEYSAPAAETLNKEVSNNDIAEISPAEDTDIAEHTLDEQVISDEEEFENLSPVSVNETNGIEFHPGLENITLFEESGAIQGDSAETEENLLAEQKPGVYTVPVDIFNDPVYIIEKEKEDTSVDGDSDEAKQEVPAELNKDHKADLIEPAVADTTVVNNLNPEAPAEDTYSGAGKIEERGIEHVDEVNPGFTEEEPVAETENTSGKTNIAAVNESAQSTDIDDDVYDEITGIENIHLDNTPKADELAVSIVPVDTEEDKLIIENIAATDFFMFDDAFGNTREEDIQATEPQPVLQPASPGRAPETAADTPAESATPVSVIKEEQQDVSKYNDDKMPYTFMWWLDKTRREHAGISQPYAEKKQPEAPAGKQADDVLQQQYYSNLFHISSVEELTKDKPAQPFSFGLKNRSLQIIEKFIKEEPQIKPQSSDKLDNENKAKKSSEDRDEIVTETLAAIYTEQMLYYKAIAAYKKLMLKFPEKSSYFADKIEQLNKKLN